MNVCVVILVVDLLVCIVLFLFLGHFCFVLCCVCGCLKHPPLSSFRSRAILYIYLYIYFRCITFVFLLLNNILSCCMLYIVIAKPLRCVSGGLQGFTIVCIGAALLACQTSIPTVPFWLNAGALRQLLLEWLWAANAKEDLARFRNYCDVVHRRWTCG